jgi:hypothetical protein
MQPTKTRLEIFEENVAKFGSIDNYLRYQLLTDPDFIVLDDEEPDYEEKTTFRTTHTPKQYIEKNGGVHPIVYKKLGIEIPNLSIA